MKAAVKDCGSDPSVLCLDMLCIQRNCCVQGSALPSPAHALSREAERFSAVGVGPGLEDGGEREKRREKNKTKQIYWLCRGSPDTLGHCFTPEKSATPCWKPPSSNCQSGLVCKTPHSEIPTTSQPAARHGFNSAPWAAALQSWAAAAPAPCCCCPAHPHPSPQEPTRSRRSQHLAQVRRDEQHTSFNARLCSGTSWQPGDGGGSG